MPNPASFPRALQSLVRLITSHIAAANPHPQYASSQEGVTDGNAHDHTSGKGAQISHTSLSNIGTNTHAQIDTHIADTSNPHSVTAAQAGADPAGTAAAEVAAHEAALNPHPTYLTQAEGDALYAALDADLTALAGLGGTGLAVRTAANTWTTRSLAAGAGLSVTNPAGVGGDPTLAVDQVLEDLDTLGPPGAADLYPYSTASGVFAYGTVTSFARTLLDDANAPTARTTLGIYSTPTYRYKTSTQDCGAGAIVTFASGSVSSATNVSYSVGTFTADVTGLYEVLITFSFSTSSTGMIAYLRDSVAGGETPGTRVEAVVAGGAINHGTISAVLNMPAGNTFDFYAQRAGGAGTANINRATILVRQLT